MSSLCNEEVVFYQKNGGSEQLERFYHDLKESFEQGDSCESTWVGSLLLHLGVTREELESDAWYCHCEVEHYRLNHSDKDSSLHLATSTDWQPSIQVWDWLAAHYDVNYVIKAEEEGCGFYLNTDTTHRFLTQRYAILKEGLDTWYGKTVEDVIKHLNGLTSNYGFSELEENSFSLPKANQLHQNITIHPFHTHCRIIDNKVVEAYTI